MFPVSVYLVLATAALGLVALYVRLFYRKRQKGEPVTVPGNFIWGNGAAFAENAVEFIHKATAKYGTVFNIRLLHQHLTIINDPHSYEQFCKEKNFDFDPIQKQVNNNVFSFQLFDARQMIKEAGKKVKGKYMVANMQSFSKHLDNTFEETVQESKPGMNEWCEDGLRSMASKTMFRAIFRSIFGKERPGDQFEPIKVYKSFDIFHKYFNFLWLGLPIKLFPRAGKALEVLIQQPNSCEVMGRDDVSEYIKYSTNFMLEHGQSEADIIGHNLVFLHVNYNTFRVSFWLIYYLTQNEQARKELLAEILEMVKEKSEYSETDGPVEITLEDMERMQYLDSYVKETIRYTSGVFMVRSVAKDTYFEKETGEEVLIRAGDRVAIYPPAIHKDPEIFENPLQFKADRFVNATFTKNGREVKNPIIAFGSLCPGKKLAITQAKWYLLNLVYKFDFKITEGQTCEPDVHYHGHEILPPTNDVNILYKRKENVRPLELV